MASFLKRKVSRRLAAAILTVEVATFLIAFTVGVYQGMNIAPIKATTGDVNVPAGAAYKYNNQIFGMAQTDKSNYFLGGAGNLTMTGRGNVAMGGQALLNNTTGMSNTVMGSQALANNTTGGSNTIIGNQAAAANSTGSGNVAIGIQSLVNNRGGNYNTAIGETALSSNLGGNYNVGIGYGSNVLNNGDTNEIVIGYQALGAGSNTVTLGNSSISKTLLRGNVGIGTTAPLVRLDVAGLIRTAPTSSTACNSTVKGAIYYNSGDNHFYGCNGTTWKQLDN